MGRKVVRADIQLIINSLDTYSAFLERRGSEHFKAGNQQRYQDYVKLLARCRDLKRRLSETISAANNSLTSNSGHKLKLSNDDPVKPSPFAITPINHCPYCYCSSVKEMHFWEKTQVIGKNYHFQKGFDCGYIGEIEPHGKLKEIGRCMAKHWENR